MTIIAPSLLSMDFSDTKKALDELNKSKAEWLHFDVMDGHFVPNLTFGTDILKGIRKGSSKKLDVHLMITDPAKYAPKFIEAGAGVLTFHLEAMSDMEDCIMLCREIQKSGCMAGISIKPKTPIEAIESLLDVVDLVLVMSVEPGFGGQQFDESALAKIAWLKEKRDQNQGNFIIEVDGGINQTTGHECQEAGADVLVAGSYVFQADIQKAVESLL